MKKISPIKDIGSLRVSVVYKHSRYVYAAQQRSNKQKNYLKKHSDIISKELFRAHEENIFCIKKVEDDLKKLAVDYSIFCRSEVKPSDLKNSFVICVGGDGTLLDASHYCVDTPVLGVNSDPKNSIGALCAATANNFLSIMQDIYDEKIIPMPVTRLSLRLNGQKKLLKPLNDILYCHKNPAALSRFYLSLGNIIESHRSSGIWVATGAGSTGGIYSSGAQAFDFSKKKAVFRVREPYWSNSDAPSLLSGTITQEQTLKITSNMSDARLFIDGPHKSLLLPLGQSLEIGVSEKPLWLFDQKNIEAKRKKILEQREPYRRFLKVE
ncbi:MAG: NAD(+)/NADH kinase [Myxococcales bacterium]|nr:NAD(+)/NADH kinase [Myxococcales bacterium]USN49948.1 MAG: NAD(+)/NADH kinase [Myxococcales bacterium]